MISVVMKIKYRVDRQQPFKLPNINFFYKNQNSDFLNKKLKLRFNDKNNNNDESI